MEILIIGAGAIGRHHATAIRKHVASESANVAVADPSSQALEQFLAEFPDVLAFSDVAEAVGRPAGEDDISIVAAPPSAHCELTIAALASGRHVLCEKPLALDVAEARQMLAAARRNGRLLGCCSARLVSVPGTQEVKRLIAAGAIGEPYHVTWISRLHRARAGVEYQPSSRWFLDRSKNGGGILQDWGPYDFSALNELFEPDRVEVLSAFCANPETALPDLQPGTVFDVEQHVGASLRYHPRAGAPLIVTYERAACTHGTESSLVEVEGSKGALTWDWLDWAGLGEVRLTTDEGGRSVTETITVPVEPNVIVHDRPLLGFLAAVEGLESKSVLNDQAVFNFACVRAIYDCVTSGRPQDVSAAVSAA